MLQEMPKIQETWIAELERRKQDEAKDNPRVEFLTTKGIVEIELFEDEAPESVASFIYLVEQGYYNRKPIFLVRRHWLAQTGCEKGDGKGTAGYTISFEGNSPNHRNHFRGSLAIPLGIDTENQTIDPNSGGAQFYFSFLPLPLFDGKHAVFGRIVSGIEVLGLLKEVNLTDEEQRKDPNLQPDRVVNARVLKKRNHEYRPTPILGRLPR
jgi:cyclophilin family peptidyl-prolyl cis-trans isomerase